MNVNNIFCILEEIYFQYNSENAQYTEQNKTWSAEKLSALIVNNHIIKIRIFKKNLSQKCVSCYFFLIFSTVKSDVTNAPELKLMNKTTEVSSSDT